MESKTKGTTKVAKAIEQAAVAFQQLAREVKEIEAKMKPHKDALLKFAKDNPGFFDEAFQIKFKNGTYIQSRVADVLTANTEARQMLEDNLESVYLNVSLNDKKLIEDAKTDARLMKMLTKAGAGIGQKETLAVYAG